MTTSLDDPPAGAPPGADRAVVDVDVRVVPDGDTYLAVVSCDAFGTSTTRPFTPPVAADVTAFADALAAAGVPTATPPVRSPSGRRRWAARCSTRCSRTTHATSS